MTFEQLLRSIGNGLPLVTTSRPINGANTNVGQVTVVKNNGRHKGIGVQFPPLQYDVWFWDDPAGTDQRTHYMHELTLVAAVPLLFIDEARPILSEVKRSKISFSKACELLNEKINK